MKAGDKLEDYLVVKNLKKSPFKIETESFVFYFSSAKKLNLFETNLIECKKKLEKKVGYKGVDVEKWGQLLCYEQAEKRGFYVVDYKGVVHEWLESIILSGVLKTKNHCKKW